MRFRSQLLLSVVGVLLLVKSAGAQSPAPPWGTCTGTSMVYDSVQSTCPGQRFSGYANLNSQLWANNFAGADMGAQVNTAIASAPTGAIINIPQGVYNFATTIQCPITGGGPMFIIRGAGMGASQDVANSTVLRYTGSGSAIDQTVTNPTWQNQAGCQLENLKLDGSAGNQTSNVGMSFGGTMYTKFTNVAIEKFNRGVLARNVGAGMFTERYYADNLTMQQNHIGWQWRVETGAAPSVGHFKLDPVFCNPSGSGTDACFETNSTSNPGVLVYDGDININGNIGTGPGGDSVFILSSSGDQFLDLVIQGYPECNENPGPCVRFAVAGGATVSSNVFLLWMDAPGFVDSIPNAVAGVSPFIGWDGLIPPLGILAGYTLQMQRSLNAIEGPPPTAITGVDQLWGDVATHRWKTTENGGGQLFIPREVTAASIGIGSSPIAPNNCLAPVTQAAPGVLATDMVVWGKAGPVAVGTESSLITHAWATANNVTFLECNPTAGQLTPPAVTLYFMVVRP